MTFVSIAVLLWLRARSGRMIALLSRLVVWVAGLSAGGFAASRSRDPNTAHSQVDEEPRATSAKILP